MTRITRIGTDKDQVKEIACEKYENRRKRLGRPAAPGKETAHETHEAREVVKKNLRPRYYGLHSNACPDAPASSEKKWNFFPRFPCFFYAAYHDYSI